VPKIDPQDVFRSAESFAIACAALHTAVLEKKFMIMTIVMATLEALTLEPYLKTLLLMENEEYRSGHDLFKLFKFLKPETQTELSKAHDKYLADNPSFVVQAKLKNFPTDLESLLIRRRHSFVDFRYAHEGKAGKTVSGLHGLESAFETVSRSLNPNRKLQLGNT
jgi:hypothetical protein